MYAKSWQWASLWVPIVMLPWANVVNVKKLSTKPPPIVPFVKMSMQLSTAINVLSWEAFWHLRRLYTSRWMAIPLNKPNGGECMSLFLIAPLMFSFPLVTVVLVLVVMLVLAIVLVLVFMQMLPVHMPPSPQ